ncbi:DEAD/DEAH box helicase [Clostridium thermarum]|uniref:DEAD/DEAH box helicase n=1 Tax=Clostridium thermarum TaxID=1716543 RepID=UPI001123598B|nr:DEAD/DEAH box helicase [Clostridium thermarum]
MGNKSFKEYNISEEILKALNLLGYERPTEVQSEVIEVALRKKDLIVKSQTGSGKTAAYGIPICESLDIEQREPQALILTPTRELAVQVKEDITNIGRFKRVRCAAVFGKQPMAVQLRELKQRVHVIAGTPGRVMDHIKRGSIDLQKVQYLVIDEADKMLNMGFIDQVGEIIETLPESRATMLFSATMPEEIERLCSKYMKKPVSIQITPKKLVSERVDQDLYEVDKDHKFELLKKILYIENPDSCIIFCSTKENVDTLNEKMRAEKIYTRALHGGMEQKDRLELMKYFKRGEFRILVATDVAARGIDVTDLDLIINYDVPVENESYVHRIGRTARAGKSGKAVTFAAPYEKKYLNQVEEYIGYSIPRKAEPSGAEAEKAKVAFMEKEKRAPVIKKDKSEELNKEVTKVYINAGKKKKMRPGDIVGAITSIEGVSGEDIGIIDILDHVSYVDILNGKGDKVIKTLQKIGIKGKEVKVQRASK